MIVVSLPPAAARSKSFRPSLPLELATPISDDVIECVPVERTRTPWSVPIETGKSPRDGKMISTTGIGRLSDLLPYIVCNAPLNAFTAQNSNPIQFFKEL